MVHSFKSDELQKIVLEAVDHFLRGPIESFPPVVPFVGGGVYALYYLGDFPLYKDIKLTEITDNSIPIYVGKSNPSGWRTARISTTGKKNLYGRIKEHYRNVNYSPLSRQKIGMYLVHGQATCFNGTLK